MVRSVHLGPVLVFGGVQFCVGCVLESEQRVVSARYSPKDLVQFALGRLLVARLGVLDDENHHKGERGYQGLEDAFPPHRKSSGDAHGNPRPRSGNDQDRGQRPGRMPVYSRQPVADRGPGPFR
jgi:hypothetical protein